VTLRQSYQGLLELLEGAVGLHADAFGVEAYVGGHLVVAAARGVQLPGHLAQNGGQAALHGHVDVLVGHIPDELAGLDFLEDLAEPVHQLLRLLGGDDPLAAQHAGVSDAAGDILGIEAAVKGQGRAELLHQPVGVLGKAASP
jgi:hypothetical protein